MPLLLLLLLCVHVFVCAVKRENVCTCVFFNCTAHRNDTAYRTFSHYTRVENVGLFCIGLDHDGSNREQTVCFEHYTCAEGFMRSCASTNSISPTLCVFGAINLILARQTIIDRILCSCFLNFSSDYHNRKIVT